MNRHSKTVRIASFKLQDGGNMSEVNQPEDWYHGKKQIIEKYCPSCKSECTMAVVNQYIESIESDEPLLMTVPYQYFRCLRCLKLFRQILTEVTDNAKENAN